ncbi:hypothetical protein ACJJTC_000040 [Scirpophaga incertulas]
MFLARTPAKKAPEQSPTPSTPTTTTSPVHDKERAGPSPSKKTTNVRRSIGEIEGKIGKVQPCASSGHAHSPTTTGMAPAPAPGPPQRLKQRTTSTETRGALRRTSAEAAGASQEPKKDQLKSTDRVTQARVWLQRAKSYLGESRNLRADLKTGITLAVDSLYKLVKEMAEVAPEKKETINQEEMTEEERTKKTISGGGEEEILRLLREQGEKIGKTLREVEKMQEPRVQVRRRWEALARAKVAYC